MITTSFEAEDFANALFNVSCSKCTLFVLGTTCAISTSNVSTQREATDANVKEDIDQMDLEGHVSVSN